MTDELETSLRTLLAQRAAGVRPDVAAGERAVADALQHGDIRLGEALATEPPRPRNHLLLVAAVVVVIVGLGATALLRDDDVAVDTGPVATTPPAPAPTSLEFRPVLLTGPCADLRASAVPARDVPLCYQLGPALRGNELIESVQRYTSFSGHGTLICTEPGCEDDVPSTSTTRPGAEGVSLTLTADGIERFNAVARTCFERATTCPTGQLAIVIDGVVLSAPSIETPSFEADQITLEGDLTSAEADALAAGLAPRPDLSEP